MSRDMLKKKISVIRGRDCVLGNQDGILEKARENLVVIKVG